MHYLLIHGGGSTARFWDRLLPHLDGPALAVNLPGRADRPADLAELTVEQEVSSVLDDARSGIPEGEIVIVAHSSGGLVVPGVVAGLGARVARVILNAALVPPEGGSGLDCLKPHQREGLVATVEAARASGTAFTLPGPPDDPEPLRRAYGGDPLDDETLRYIADPRRSVPDTVHHYFQPVRWSSAAHVAVTYLLNERDRPVSPAMQEAMVERLPSEPRVLRLDTGHIPAVTCPRRFAAALRPSRAAGEGLR